MTSHKSLDHLAWLIALCLAGCASNQAHVTPAPGRGASAQAEPIASSDRLAQEGLRSLELGDTLRAEQYLRMAVRAGYPEERLILPLLKACVASSRLRSALMHAEPYLRRHPDAYRVRYLVAAVQLALGHPERAFTELARVVAQRPDLAQAHYLLGVVLRDSLGDEPAARQSFAHYLERAPHGEHAPELHAYLAETASALAGAGSGAVP